MEESESQGGFKVSDRRRFTTEGEPAENEGAKSEDPGGSQAAAEEPAQPGETQEAGPSSQAQTQEFPGDQGKEVPPMDFISFVMSLANTAIVQMGLAQSPETGEPMKDLAGAKQLIDIIGLLEEKTKGNLNEEEKKILTDTLFQLRMAYVEASK
jgi:hypothetical protein